MVYLHRFEKRVVSSARTTTSTSTPTSTLKSKKAIIGTPVTVVAAVVPKSSTVKNNPGSTHLVVTASVTSQTAADTATATATSNASDLAESTAAQPPAIGTSMILGIGIVILLILGIIGIFVRRKILARKFDTSDDKELIANNQPGSRSISSKEDHSDLGSLSDSARPLSVTSELNHVYHVPSEMTQTRNNGISNNMNPYTSSHIPWNQPDMRPDHVGYIVSNPAQPISSNLHNSSDNPQSSIQSNDPSTAQPDHNDYIVSKPAQPTTNNFSINNNSDNSQSSVQSNDPFMDSHMSDVDNGIDNEIDNGIDNEIDNGIDNEIDNGVDNEIDNEINNEIDDGIDDGTDYFTPVIDVDDTLAVPLNANEIPPQIPPLTLSGNKKNLIKPANDHEISSNDRNQVLDQDQTYLEFSRPTSHPLDDLETIFAQFHYDNKSDDLAEGVTISTAVKVAEPFTFSAALSTVVAKSPDQSSPVVSSVTIDVNGENLKQTNSGLSNQSDDLKKTVVHPVLKQDESSQLAQPAEIAEFANAESITTTTNIVGESETAAKKSKPLLLAQTDLKKENDVLLIPASPVPSISVTSDDSETEEVMLMATLEYAPENNLADDTASTPEEITEPLASIPVIEGANESSIFVDSKSEQESTIDSSVISPSTTSAADKQLSTASKLYRSPTLSMFSLYDQETTEQQSTYRPPIHINGSHVKSVVTMFDTGRIVDAKKANQNNSGS